jgi:hypothetical protein
VNRHRTLEALGVEIEKVARRVAALTAAPESTDADSMRSRFAEVLAVARREAGDRDLAAAHRAYVALRRAARGVVVSCRAEFPVEGFAFSTR